MYHSILDTPCDLSSNYIACNQNGIWSFLGPFDDIVFSVEIYNNELYACGWFSSINGQPISHLTKYNGSVWLPVPGFISAINPGKLKVINNELYLCGGIINTTAGSFNGVAKFDGTNWSGFSVPSLGDPGTYVSDVALYNNELYIAGNFSLSNGSQDFAYYHNNQWQRPGIGITGSMSAIEKLEIYKNKLYIGGLIYKHEGNVGNMIVAWDGNVLASVGDGLKDNLNSYGAAQVHDMMVFHNKLYIAGTFNYAGNIFSCGLTVFDGNRFCSFNKTPQLSVGLGAIGHYRDTIYVSGALKYLNDSIYNIGKYIGNGLYDTCSVYYDVGVVDRETLMNWVNVFPNPAENIIYVSAPQNSVEGSSLEIVNCLGQILSIMPLCTQIDISELPNGIYTLRIKRKGQSDLNAKFIKKY